MSIMQETERIRQELGEKEWELIIAFLTEHEEYYLADLLYARSVWAKYEEWKSRL